MKTKIILLIGLFFGNLSSFVTANMIEIPDDYAEIQDAVDSCTAGDTILIHPGIYYENIQIENKSVIIGSLFMTTGDTSYISSTIIDGDSSGGVFFLSDCNEDTSLITGLTIRNGVSSTGGGIGCISSHLMITDNIITNNQAPEYDFDNTFGWGGGICCLDSDPVISNNIIESNNAAKYGGGLYCHNARAIIKDNIIKYNLSTFGGGGIYCDSSNSVIEGNIIHFNLILTEGGGGIACLNNSQAQIKDNDISGNGPAFLGGVNGGGIYCHNSNPTIENNRICSNTAASGFYSGGSGGGIACDSAHPIISGNYICRNKGETGSAIGLDYSSPTIINNIIAKNMTDSYGTIYCSNSNPEIINNTICFNKFYYTYDNSGNIYCNNSNPIITNTILWGNGKPEMVFDGVSNPVIAYNDIEGGWDGEGNIDDDPMFVRGYNICLQSPCINAGNPAITDPDETRSDIGRYFDEHRECVPGQVWYVSTDGDDSTGSGSVSSPFQTIQHAVNMSYSLDTVIIDNGTYFENLILEMHNIVLVSNYIYSGNREDIINTIIDGQSLSSVIIVNELDSASAIRGLTIQNGGGIDNFWLGEWNPGGGIRLYDADPMISDNIIVNNMSFDYGGGIYCSQSNPLITNNIIAQNHSDLGDGGGGIYCGSSSPHIINNVINENSAYSVGGIRCYGFSEPKIVNTIISANTYPQLAGDYSSAPVVSYSNIQGGYEGEGNISADPLFIGDYYNVCSSSPCLDSGDPNIIDPDSTRSDIGLFYANHPDCNNGRVIHVKIIGNDSTGDGSSEKPFRTIQHAVNTATTLDTVIVYRGNYLENIVISDKSPVISSRYLFTGSNEDINNTVIIGDTAAATMLLEGGYSSLTVMGLKILSGKGLVCENSQPLISDVIVDKSEGVGITCNYSKPVIRNSLISHSKSTGIRIAHSEATIYNCKFMGNHYPGIVIYYSDAQLSDCEIIANGGGITGYSSSFDISNCLLAYNLGSGINCIGSGIDQHIKDCIIRNNYRGGGIYCSDGAALLIENTTISENSSDSKGGGIYIDHASPEIRNCIINDNTAPEGGGIYCVESDAIITDCQIAGNENFGLKIAGGGVQLMNSEIKNNPDGGIHCIYGGPGIENCIISDNAGTFGGGASFEFSNPILSHNVFYNNSALCGGAINCRASDMHIINNTIVNNTADSLGGGIFCITFSKPVIENSIIWDNYPTSVHQGNYYDIDYTFCDIDEEVVGEGNISEDPLFCGPEENNYELSNISPCIGAGQNGENIGALGVGCTMTDAAENNTEDDLLPKTFELSQNYPNPFNPTTIIEYALPEACQVEINIYNILGQKVTTLINQTQSTGWYNITWNGADDHGMHMATGMYFYQIVAGDFVKSKKMLLLK